MSFERAYAAPAAVSSGPVEPLRLRHLVLVAMTVGLCAFVYGSTILTSYFANGLDAVPLSQVGTVAYDPENPPILPSATSAMLGYLAVLLTPFVCLVGALLVGDDVLHALRAGRPRRAVVPSVAVLTLCLAVLMAYIALGPLSSWWLD